MNSRNDRKSNELWELKYTQCIYPPSPSRFNCYKARSANWPDAFVGSLCSFPVLVLSDVGNKKKPPKYTCFQFYIHVLLKLQFFKYSCNNNCIKLILIIILIINMIVTIIIINSYYIPFSKIITIYIQLLYDIYRIIIVLGYCYITIIYRYFSKQF